MDPYKKEQIERNFKKSIGAQLFGVQDPEFTTYTWKQFQRDKQQESTRGLMTFNKTKF